MSALTEYIQGEREEETLLPCLLLPQISSAPPCESAPFQNTGLSIFLVILALRAGASDR